MAFLVVSYVIFNVGEGIIVPALNAQERYKIRCTAPAASSKKMLSMEPGDSVSY